MCGGQEAPGRNWEAQEELETFICYPRGRGEQGSQDAEQSRTEPGVAALHMGGSWEELCASVSSFPSGVPSAIHLRGRGMHAMWSRSKIIKECGRTVMVSDPIIQIPPTRLLWSGPQMIFPSV